ncbi:YihY/virulence factor BrkB family protein [Wenzhouxiangella sp. AB-CW3]|uniref:YihY/virulence factor BrkB family protein n=1 Tax=Wenzhouxiangella sp. AB-CW3 TaxID=2771012 RepID=UPI00168AF1B1|nr:YihY/virulence factor BrkB family protein [Wenzhouxiangella sp. AB-CW3]QOC23559.1 YihY/virulence factor BrkB family protein [Wenzhouxiangella sp. AB-CW3]
MELSAVQRLLVFVRYWGSILVAAASNWLQSQAFIYAAALAFFTVFSIAPVMIVVVTVVGLVLGERAAKGELMDQLEEVLGSQAAEVVQTAVVNSQIEQSGIWPTLAGIVAIVLGATTVFAQMQQSLNQIWDVAPRPSKNSLWIFIKARVLSLTIVLAIGFVLMVSLLLSVAMRAIMAFAEQWLPVPGWAMVSIEMAVSLAVITMLFAAIFKILPDVVLGWRDVLAGALITAVLFTAGRSLIAMYLANTATASTYGAAGSLVLLLLWVNYSSLILLYGASITRAHLEARGKRIQPGATAVCVHRELIEEPADSS